MFFNLSTHELSPMSAKRHRMITTKRSVLARATSRAYMPKDYAAYKNTLRYLIENKHPKITAGPLCAAFRFRFNAPRSWSYKKAIEAYQARVLVSGKRDIDNLCKTVMDAAQGLIYNNDAQIVGVTAWKEYASSCGTDMFFYEAGFMKELIKPLEKIYE